MLLFVVLLHLQPTCVLLLKEPHAGIHLLEKVEPFGGVWLHLPPSDMDGTYIADLAMYEQKASNVFHYMGIAEMLASMRVLQIAMTFIHWVGTLEHQGVY